jgi:uncharacterized damage-inducible protein DinB
MSLTSALAALFNRDLTKLRKQIEAFPNDELLWQALPGVTNSAGNLALHLEGNLRQFVGRQLGGLPYERKRALEFSSTGMSRDEISARVGELGSTIPSVIEELSLEQMGMEYPEVVIDVPMTTQQCLFHLYGHLNWHLGQIDYLRRMLVAERGIQGEVVVRATTEP